MKKVNWERARGITAHIPSEDMATDELTAAERSQINILGDDRTSNSLCVSNTSPEELNLSAWLHHSV